MLWSCIVGRLVNQAGERGHVQYSRVWKQLNCVLSKGGGHSQHSQGIVTAGEGNSTANAAVAIPDSGCAH